MIHENKTQIGFVFAILATFIVTFNNDLSAFFFSFEFKVVLRTRILRVVSLNYFVSDDLVGLTEKLAANRFGGGLSFVFDTSFLLSFGLISGGLFNLIGDSVTVSTSIFGCASSF